MTSTIDNLDYSDDYLLWCNTEPVTFVSVVRGQQDGVVRVDKAIRNPVTTRERAASGGAYTGSDRSWQMPQKLLGAYKPKPGDYLVTDDGSERWTVLDCEHVPIYDIWDCTTRNLAVVFELSEILRVEYPVWSQDDAGMRAPTWGVRWKGRGRLQEVSASEVTEQGTRWTSRQATVYVEDNINLSTDMRIVDESNVIWTIDSWSNPYRIDELLTINVSRTGL